MSKYLRVILNRLGDIKVCVQCIEADFRVFRWIFDDFLNSASKSHQFMSKLKNKIPNGYLSPVLPFFMKFHFIERNLKDLGCFFNDYIARLVNTPYPLSIGFGGHSSVKMHKNALERR